MVTDSHITRVARHVMGPLKRRVMLAASRGVVNLITDVAAKMPRVQVSLLKDETADDVEHFQPYGMASRPPAGAEAIVLSIGGNRDHLVAVVISHRQSRPLLAPKDSAIYTDDGNRVHCKADGEIAAVPSSGKFVHLGADAASDFVALAADVKARIDALQVAHDTHKHATAAVGPPVVPDVIVGALAPVAATLVKAE